MTVVAKAATGDESIAHYRKHEPDAMVMDSKLSRVSGLTATVKIQRAHEAAGRGPDTGHHDRLGARNYTSGLKAFL